MYMNDQICFEREREREREREKEREWRGEHGTGIVREE